MAARSPIDDSVLTHMLWRREFSPRQVPGAVAGKSNGAGTGRR
jgi:hypothetical protein